MYVSYNIITFIKNILDLYELFHKIRTAAWVNVNCTLRCLYKLSGATLFVLNELRSQVIFFFVGNS